jgi:hypothetical protein
VKKKYDARMLISEILSKNKNNFLINQTIIEIDTHIKLIG